MKRLKIFDTGARSDTASRRVLTTPSYVFVFWRWSMWFYALIVILSSDHGSPHYFNAPLAIILNHVSHILVKLGLARRSEAAAYAVEHRLVPPREQS